MQKLILSMGSILFALGCGGAQPAAEAPSPTPASGTAAEAPPSVAPPATFADQVALGQTLYGKNCAGCHGGAGGGGIGPPLADEQWIYGSSDANIYASIVQGRPNGMPAFGPSLQGEVVWKLAAYVKSLSARAEAKGE